MLENLYYTFLAVIIPAIYLVFGLVFTARVPPLGSSMGIKTKMTTRSKKTWEVGHKFAAQLFIAYAVVLGALCAAWLIIPWGDRRALAFWCYVAIEFISLLSLAPLINRHIKTKLNLKWVK